VNLSEGIIICDVQKKSGESSKIEYRPTLYFIDEEPFISSDEVITIIANNAKEKGLTSGTVDMFDKELRKHYEEYYMEKWRRMHSKAYFQNGVGWSIVFNMSKLRQYLSNEDGKNKPFGLYCNCEPFRNSTHRNSDLDNTKIEDPDNDDTHCYLLGIAKYFNYACISHSTCVITSGQVGDSMAVFVKEVSGEQKIGDEEAILPDMPICWSYYKSVGFNLKCYFNIIRDEVIDSKSIHKFFGFVTSRLPERCISIHVLVRKRCSELNMASVDIELKKLVLFEERISTTTDTTKWKDEYRAILEQFSGLEIGVLIKFCELIISRVKWEIEHLNEYLFITSEITERGYHGFLKPRCRFEN
jgi:hypothetical protein